MTEEIVVATHRHSRSIAELHHRTHTESFRSFADKSWIADRQMADYLGFWDAYLGGREPRERTWVALEAAQVIGTVTTMSLENSSRLFRPSSRHDHPDEAVASRPI